MNILQISDESIVSKTTLSRKLTLGGVTKAYPVYRVRLDQLFYNDQNDRIATWITQYKNDKSNARNIDFKKLSPLYTLSKSNIPRMKNRNIWAPFLTTKEFILFLISSFLVIFFIVCTTLLDWILDIVALWFDI